jgi:hypothetical protein
MNFPSRDLTNQFISRSYQDVVQQYLDTGSFLYLLDGYGNVIFQIPSASYGGIIVTQDQSASYALQALSASFAPSSPSISASYALSSSYSISASYAISSSNTISSSYSITSTMADVATFAELSLTASLADTASISISSSYATSASYALSASHADVADLALTANNAISASYALSASHADVADLALTANNATSASYALSASHADVADLALTANNATSASYALSASHADVADLALTANNATSASYALSASHADTTDLALTANNATSASYALSASHANVADLALTANNATSASHALSALQSISSSFASSSLSASYAPFSPSGSWYLPLSSSIQADTSEEYNHPYQEGRLFWDAKEKTYSLYNDINGVTLQLGQKNILRVVAGENIPNGAAVYITASSGIGPAGYIRPICKLALADGTQTKVSVIGISTHDILSGSIGWVTTFGVVNNLDTSAFIEGDILYLSGIDSGSYSNINPLLPRETVKIGTVLVSDSTDGSIFVSTTPRIRTPAILSAGMTSIPLLAFSGSNIFVSTASVSLYDNPAGSNILRNYYLQSASLSAPTTGSTYFIVAKYNGGNPIYDILTDRSSITYTDIVMAATAVRTFYDEFHYIDWDEQGFALSNKLNERLVRTWRFAWESGLALSESGSQAVATTSGRVWHGATSQEIPSDNSGLNPLRLFYHSASQWTSSLFTQYNNTQYDNGTDLQTLTNNRYAVNYVYRLIGNTAKTFVVLGNDDYNLVQAQASQPPPNLPNILSESDGLSILIGRIIVQKDALISTQIDSAFITPFTPSSTTIHNDLSGLQGGSVNEYFHLTSAEYGTTSSGSFVRISGSLITGSISNAVSASYSISSSYAISSSNTISSSYALTSSHSITSSYISSSNIDGTIPSSSYAITASFILGSVESSSYALSASYAISSSIAQTASFSTFAFQSLFSTQSSFSTQSLFATSASWASQSLSSSYAINALNFVGTNLTASNIGAADNDDFRLFVGGLERIIVNNTSGSVGIGGQTGSVHKLEITAIDTSGLSVVNTSTPSAGSGAGLSAFTSNYPSAPDQRLGFYTMGARSGSVGRNSVAILGFSSQEWSSTDGGSYMTFQTMASGSISRLERMRIAGNGNISIGGIVTDPVNKLDVSGNISCSVITASFLLGTSSLAISSSTSISASYALSASSALTSSYVIYSTTITNAINNATTSIISIPNTIYSSIFVNYVLTDSQNFRAGNIVVLYTTSSAVLSETSTTDIGNSNELQFSASISSSFVQLLAINNTNDDFSIKYHYEVL